MYSFKSLSALSGAVVLLHLLQGCGMPDVKSLIRLDRSLPALTTVSSAKSLETKGNALFTFTSNKTGKLLYENHCSAETKTAKKGTNTISFSNLPDGYYDYCTVTLLDDEGRYSNTIAIPPFTVSHTDMPVLQEVIAVPAVTYDATPRYTFQSNRAGTITYSGPCSSSQTDARTGNNSIIFNTLEEGYYDDCQITLTDTTGKQSQPLQISPFSVESKKSLTVQEHFTIQRLATLSPKLKESSGLAVIEGRLFTHNDSGGSATIYEIDHFGQIVRSVEIAGATNVDWEDLAQDESYLYIADIGNNSGDRKDLKIYKIAKEKLLTEERVTCETISFHYEDQTAFDPAPFKTAYDAEALIAYGNKLYIFTKNWLTKETTIYALPKEQGSYTAGKVQSYPLGFLVTSATYNDKAERLILTGYSSITARKQSIAVTDLPPEAAWRSENIKIVNPENSSRGFRQIEAIACDGAEVYITSEEMSHPLLGKHPASLFSVDIFQ